MDIAYNINHMACLFSYSGSVGTVLVLKSADNKKI